MLLRIGVLAVFVGMIAVPGADAAGPSHPSPHSGSRSQIAAPTAEQLIGAILVPDQPAVSALLRAGANPNGVWNGLTPIHHAANLADPAILKLLLKHGADPNTMTSWGTTALMRSTNPDNPENVRLMIGAGARLEQEGKDGSTVVFIAAYFNKPKALQVLLSHGAKPDVPNSSGTTPLMAAATSGAIEPLKALLSAGASIDKTNKFGQSALLLAANRGKSDAMQVLIASKADLNLRDASGSNVLKLLIDGRLSPEKKLLALEQLRNAGFDFKQPCVGAISGVSYAFQTGQNPSFLEGLLEVSPEPNQADQDGSTPLHLAALRGNLTWARILLGHHADARIRNGAGNTPFWIALTSHPTQLRLWGILGLARLGLYRR